MFSVQRDDAEKVTLFDQEHDRLGVLNDLNGIERYSWEVQYRQATRYRFIDPTNVVGVQNLLRGPRLVRRWSPEGDPRARAGFWHTDSLVSLFPGSYAGAARLPE